MKITIECENIKNNSRLIRIIKKKKFVKRISLCIEENGQHFEYLI